jgi:hypothetical protein
MQKGAFKLKISPTAIKNMGFKRSYTNCSWHAYFVYFIFFGIWCLADKTVKIPCFVVGVCNTAVKFCYALK